MITRRFILYLFFFGMVAFFTYCYWNNDIPFFQRDPFVKVKKYTPVIHHELATYHLEKYTLVLIALMQQESHGKGGDPMQSSESLGLPPNSIQDPNRSIKIGVKHFQNVLQYGKKRKVDFATILQAYNMGIGYINYVADHGGKHSEDLAKQFSLLQVHKHPSFYTCKKTFFQFRYPYCYGDYSYSEKVSKNISLLTASH
ncbi:MAG: lysozyme family protein [Bacillota bacterium]|nr:lysozyme family protein [Bacillota bacterium]